MWIYPFNGRDPNDIAERAPFALLAFEDIGDEATFPEGMSKNGNAKDIIGEKIGGDCDDYVLSEFRIPSVTAELGKETQYVEEWANKIGVNVIEVKTKKYDSFFNIVITHDT